MSNRFTIISTF